jgi:uncharacterized protein YigA (DUF484 family)
MLLAAGMAPLLAAVIGALVGGAISLFTFRATTSRQDNNQLREQLLAIMDRRHENDQL